MTCTLFLIGLPRSQAQTASSTSFSVNSSFPNYATSNPKKSTNFTVQNNGQTWYQKTSASSSFQVSGTPGSVTASTPSPTPTPAPTPTPTPSSGGGSGGGGGGGRRTIPDVDIDTETGRPSAPEQPTEEPIEEPVVPPDPETFTFNPNLPDSIDIAYPQPTQPPAPEPVVPAPSPQPVAAPYVPEPFTLDTPLFVLREEPAPASEPQPALEPETITLIPGTDYQKAPLPELYPIVPDTVQELAQRDYQPVMEPYIPASDDDLRLVFPTDYQALPNPALYPAIPDTVRSLLRTRSKTEAPHIYHNLQPADRLTFSDMSVGKYYGYYADTTPEAQESQPGTEEQLHAAAPAKRTHRHWPWSSRDTLLLAALLGAIACELDEQDRRKRRSKKPTRRRAHA